MSVPAVSQHMYDLMLTMYKFVMISSVVLSQGVAGTVKQGICTVCCCSCLSMDGSLALLNDAAISFAH